MSVFHQYHLSNGFAINCYSVVLNSVPRDTPRKMKTYVHTNACTQIGKVEKNANVHQQMRMDK